MAVFDRFAALVVGLFLLVLGVLVPAEIVHAAVLSRTGELLLPWEPVTRFLTGHDWSTSPVRALCIGVAAIGLVLLAAELKRRRRSLLTLTTDEANLIAGTTRRSVARALAVRAEQVEGVASARATVRRRSARVMATTALRDAAGPRQQLDEQLTAWLDGLGLVRPPRLRVRISARAD